MSRKFSYGNIFGQNGSPMTTQKRKLWSKFSSCMTCKIWSCPVFLCLKIHCGQWSWSSPLITNQPIHGVAKRSVDLCIGGFLGGWRTRLWFQVLASKATSEHVIVRVYVCDSIVHGSRGRTLSGGKCPPPACLCNPRCSQPYRFWRRISTSQEMVLDQPVCEALISRREGQKFIICSQ